jgi:Ca-activated chloride channel homolog
MLEFQWPLAGLAVVLPMLFRRSAAARMPAHMLALRVPSFGLWPIGAEGQRSYRWPWWMLLGWLLFVVAAMQPIWLHGEVRTPRSGRDLMLAIDLSRSMATVDFALNGRLVNRLQAAQHVGGDFLSRRSGDRAGLILFGERAYVQAPLTYDVQAVRRLLEEAEIGLAGKATAIGDAIGLALKRMRDDPSVASRVIVLLTDGENTAGSVAPERAAELARDLGVKIHTVGIGARPGQLNPLGMLTAADAVDERSLTLIAETTGGRFFRAYDTQQLMDVYAAIDQLEPGLNAEQPLRPREPLFMYVLVLALLLWTPALTPPMRNLLRAG